MSRTVSEVGEFGIIDRLHRVLQTEGAADQRAHLGIGDDAAVFAIEPGRELVATCDVQICGRHFLAETMTGREIGARAMVVNLSDLAAMGARPERALVSLGLPADFRMDDLEEIYRGISASLTPHRAVVSGGNLGKISGVEWFIDITLLGTVPPGSAISRRGARPGDAIGITGTPGASAAGLDLVRHVLRSGSEEDADSGTSGLSHEDRASFRPGTKLERVRRFVAEQPWSAPLFDAYLRPNARVSAGQALRGLASAMIDVSDGWRSDLLHLCEASSARAIVERLAPVSEAMDRAARYLGQSVEGWRLGPSDDYELLFTVPEDRWAAAEQALRSTGTGVTRIGSIRAGEASLELDFPHSEIPPGWDHFASPEVGQPIAPRDRDGSNR